MNAVSRLWSNALNEGPVARGLIDHARHYPDNVSIRKILAKACQLYYGYISSADAPIQGESDMAGGVVYSPDLHAVLHDESSCSAFSCSVFSPTPVA